MNDFRRNLTVGVFVLVAVIALGAMIVIFGEAPKALTPSYVITMYFPAAGPVRSGDPILLNGMDVGQVHSVESLPDIREGVKIVCTINARYSIPVDAQPLIREQTLALGKPAIRINVGPTNSDQTLKHDGTGVLRSGKMARGIEELIPRETMADLQAAGAALTDLATKLQPVADDLHDLLKPTSVETVDTTTGPDRPLANISTVVQRFDSSLKNFNRIMGDPENRENLAVIVKNFRTVSERGLVLSDRLVSLADKLDALAGDVDDEMKRLAGAITDNADKLGTLLNRLGQAAETLNSSKGSAGRFLNDPELYESLTLTARRLELAMKDLHETLQRWQEKGIKIEGGLLGK